MEVAPEGGFRVGGNNIPAGAPIPAKYRRQLEVSERPRDPAQGSSEAPPNYGRYNVPHVITFGGLTTSLAKAYRYSDQALRHSVENAHMMFHDPIIAGPLFARQQMVSLLNWSVTSEDDDDPKLKQVSKELTSIVSRTPRFTEYRRSLLNAIWYGRYANQHAIGFHRDRYGNKRRVVTRWVPVSGDKLLFRFDDGSGEFDPDQIGVKVTPALGKNDYIAGTRKYEASGEGMGYFLEPWERKQWAVHKHMVQDGEYEDPLSAGQIHGVGLRHFLYWIWFQKQEVMAQVAEIIDRTGLGFTIYYFPSGNMQAREEMAKVAREQAHTNAILLPYDEQVPDPIQIIPPNTAGLQALQDVVESWLGDMITRFILGQTLSSKPSSTGMNSGVSELQKDSLFQIVRYDAVNLEETLTKELLLPLRDYNFPQYRNVDFFFKISTKVSAPEQELQAINQAWQMGAKIKVADLFDKLDMAMAEEDDEVVFNPQVVQAIEQVEQGQQLGMQPGMQGQPPGMPGQAPPPGPGNANPFDAAAGQDVGPNGPPNPDEGGSAPGMPEQQDKAADEKQKLFGPILYQKDWRARIEEAAAETDTNPSSDQRKSGNYRKGRAWIRGIEIAIESPKGTKRREEWMPLACHYGYVIRHSNGGSVAAPDGKDGDKVDCYLGPDVESEIVFVIDQPKEDGRFDEHKAMLFTRSERQAKELYLANYPAGWKCGPCTALTWPQFRSWLNDGDTTKPIYKQPLKYGKQMGLFDAPKAPGSIKAIPSKGAMIGHQQTLFGSGEFSEHSVGETKYERGKTYKLNQNHRWELVEQPPAPEPVHAPIDLKPEPDKIEALPEQEHEREQAEEESAEAADSGPATHAGRGDDAGRSPSGGDSGRDAKDEEKPGKPRLVTARERFTQQPANTDRLPGSLRGHLGEHQVQGAALALQSMDENGGFLLADGTGAGKTRQILAIAKTYADEGKKVLIVAPSEVIKPDWKKGTIAGSYADDGKLMGVEAELSDGKGPKEGEWKRISRQPYSSEKSADSVAERANAEHPDQEYRVASEQHASGELFHVERRERSPTLAAGQIKVTTYNRMGAFAKDVDDDTVVIFDESHALKNAAAARAQMGNEMASRAHAVLYSTATPADKPLHIDYLFRMGIFEGKSQSEAYGDLGMTQKEITVKGKKGQRDKTVHVWMVDPKVGTAEVLKRMSGLFDRMTEKGAMIKREISMDGIPVEFSKIKLPPESKEIQDLIERELTRGIGLDGVSGLLKARVLGHQRRQQETYKIEAVKNMVQEELTAGRQVVLFMSRVNYSEVNKKERVFLSNGDFEDVVTTVHASEGTTKLLKEALMASGLKEHEIAELHGNAPTKAPEAMANFQSGKAKVVIATIESGGTGINLDDRHGDKPRTMCVVTAPFSGNDNVQAAGRVWRMSSKSQPKIRYIFADSPVDDWNASIISNKMKMLGAAVSGELKRLDIPELSDLSEGEILASYGSEGKPSEAPSGKSGSVSVDTSKLKPLAGSVKQIKWAHDIRKKSLQDVGKYLDSTESPRAGSSQISKEDAKKLHDYLHTIAGSKFWIDGRDDKPETILNQANIHAQTRYEPGVANTVFARTDYGTQLADEFRNLGGKWNGSKLAWEFPKEKDAEVKKLLGKHHGSDPKGRYAKKYSKEFEDEHPRDEQGRFVEHGPDRNEKSDQIPGGLGDKTDPSTLDPEQIKKGIKVEMEHTNDRQLAEEIARDHLSEFPDYYNHLAKMESGMKNAKDIKADDQHQPQRYSDADFFTDPTSLANHLRDNLEIALELESPERIQKVQAEIKALENCEPGSIERQAWEMLQGDGTLQKLAQPVAS